MKRLALSLLALSAILWLSGCAGGPLTKPFDVIAFHTLEAIKFCVQAHGVGAYKAAVQK